MTTYQSPKPTQNTTTSPAGCGCNHSSVLLTMLLIISIMMNGVGLYLLSGQSISIPNSNEAGISSFGIKQALLEMEYEKVGGKEAYNLINSANRIQFNENKAQIEEYVKTNGGAAKKPTDQPEAPKGDLSQDDIKAIRENLALEGSPEAPIIVIEYSDMECPFCMRQYHDTKLTTALPETFGSGVAFGFKNNRGVNHPGTDAKAIASLCAQKVGGDSAYIAYYHAIMDGSTSNGGVYPVSDLDKIPAKIGLDATAWKKCYDTKETMSLYEAQTAEANRFGLGGTPGALIINTVTGKYATVEGAYPYAAFVEKIKSVQ